MKINPKPGHQDTNWTRHQLELYSRRARIPRDDFRRLVLFLMASAGLAARGYPMPSVLMDNSTELLMRAEHEARFGKPTSSAFEGLVAAHSRELDEVAKTTRYLQRIWKLMEADMDSFWEFAKRLILEALEQGEGRPPGR